MPLSSEQYNQGSNVEDFILTATCKCHGNTPPGKCEPNVNVDMVVLKMKNLLGSFHCEYKGMAPTHIVGFNAKLPISNSRIFKIFPLPQNIEFLSLEMGNTTNSNWREQLPGKVHLEEFANIDCE